MSLNLYNPQPEDINYLRKLLADGSITQAQLSGMQINGSFNDAPPAQNMLVQMTQPAPQPAPQTAEPGMNQWDRVPRGTGIVQTTNPDGTQSAPIRINSPPQQEEGSRPDGARNKVDFGRYGKGYYGQDGQLYLDNGQRFQTDEQRYATAQNSMAEEDRQMKLEDFANKQAHTKAQIDLEKEHMRASKATTPDFSGNGMPVSQATGEAALQGVAPNVASQVKAIIDGRMEPPKGFAMKSPYWQQIMQVVGQVDPNFDMVNYGARYQTRKDFTSGKNSENIKSLNTALSHLGSLQDSYNALDNSDWPTYNKIANNISEQVLGNKAVQENVARVGTDATAIADEMAKVFRTTGMSDKEIQGWKERISTSSTPAQVKGFVGEAIKLMTGRLDQIESQYTTGMGTTNIGLPTLTAVRANMDNFGKKPTVNPQSGSLPSMSLGGNNAGALSPAEQQELAAFKARFKR